MRLRKILPLLTVVCLSACSNNNKFEKTFYCFDTFITAKIRHNNKSMGQHDLERLMSVCQGIDKEADSYNKRDVTGVYELNHTNDMIQISKQLYTILAIAQETQEKAKYFNPLVGSLSNKWKEALENNQVLSNDVIQEELEKINSSSLVLDNSGGMYRAQRNGDALIDLGAITKGFALDICKKNVLDFIPYEDYLVNAGSSSILLGNATKEKKDETKEEVDYVVKIKELSKNTYLHENRCYISTSGTSEQSTIIDGVKYSHIINPMTGSAVSLYDAVIVISDFNKEYNGAIGDVLSTSFMMSSLDEIKEVEKSSNIEVIVIKDDSVLYKSESVELF